MVEDPAQPQAHPRDRLKRKLRLTDATLLVVSGVIGSGIFLTPAAIAGLLPQPGLILAVWAVGGGISLAGALANAELAAMFPRAGGDYVYLREAYHPLAGFLVGWLTFGVIYGGTIATLAAGFAGALSDFVPLSGGAKLAVAVGLTLAISALNFLGVRWGATANNVTALAKLAGLVLFVALGLGLGAGDASRLDPLQSPSAGGATPLAFALALSPVFFSYLGWNSSVYVGSEIHDPDRTLPRSLFLGIGICTAVYLLVNAVYLYALSLDEIAAAPNAGEAAARALFGGIGGTLVGAFVLVSILGTLNATVLVGPRIAYAMALDGLFFRGVDRTHARYHTPTVAIALQALLAVGILVVLQTFERALDYTVFAILLATMADMTALVRLRRRQPERRRPYRAWGYPWLPGLYFAANAAVALALLVRSPADCAIGLAVAAAGLPFYRLFARRADGA